MRTIWNATLVVGEVAIPVGLAVASQRGGIAFRTLHRPCGTPVREQKLCAECGVAEPEELVRGWQVAPGQFVVVEASDLEAVAPSQSRAITVERFVAGDTVGPLHVDRAYHLVPAGETVGARPYVLLLRALEHSGAAAVVRFTLWQRENVGLVRPHDGTLLLQTLYLAEDIRPNSEIGKLLAGVEPREEELALATRLVHALAGPLEPALVSRQRQAVRAMLEAKLTGAPIVRAAEPATPAPTANLAEALERSLRRAKRPSRRARHAPAKRSVGSGRAS